MIHRQNNASYARTHATIALTMIIAPLALAFSFGGCSKGADRSTAGGACEFDEDCGTEEACVDGACEADPDFSGGVDDAMLGDMGMIDEGFGGAGEPTEIGAVIDSFCDINAYQNGPKIKGTHGSSAYGYRYQCTELAYRFLCQHYDLCEKKTKNYGNAKDWFTNHNDPVLKQLVRYKSGGNEPPRPGDVIVWKNGEYGHVAVVKSVSGGLVQVLEQNFYKGAHTYKLVEQNGTYSIWNTHGWMRVAGAEPACGGTPGNNPATATLTAPLQGSSHTGAFTVAGAASDIDGLSKVTITLGGTNGPVVCDQNCAGATQEFSLSVNPANYGVASGSLDVAVWVRDILGNTNGPLAVRSMQWQSGGGNPFCGDGICSNGETCGSCTADCGCFSGQTCQNGACVACGGAGQTCCNGSCNPPNACYGGICSCTPSCNLKCGGVSDGCGGTCETCPGGYTCNGQTCCQGKYSVSQYQCNAYSSANGIGLGGGKLFNVCGQVDQSTGFVTVKVHKYDGSFFGNRPYQVRVSNLGDPGCGPDTNYFQQVASNPSGIGTDTLTFSFQSNFLQGLTQKGYCVTASTQPGDPGYNAGSEQQKSWWYSDKVDVIKSCQ